MSALKPTNFKIPFLEATRAKNKDISAEEQQLYTMSKSGGWKVFKGFAERLSREMVGANNTAIEAGASFEDIGRNTLVISMAQDIITRLFNKVDDAVEVCEDGKEK